MKKTHPQRVLPPRFSPSGHLLRSRTDRRPTCFRSPNPGESFQRLKLCQSKGNEIAAQTSLDDLSVSEATAWCCIWLRPRPPLLYAALLVIPNREFEDPVKPKIFLTLHCAWLDVDNGSPRLFLGQVGSRKTMIQASTPREVGVGGDRERSFFKPSLTAYYRGSSFDGFQSRFVICCCAMDCTSFPGSLL